MGPVGMTKERCTGRSAWVISQGEVELQVNPRVGKNAPAKGWLNCDSVVGTVAANLREASVLLGVHEWRTQNEGATSRRS